MALSNYLTINVPPDLLPQVTGELLQFTRDANLVEVVHASVGQVIHADPGVVEAWMEWREAKEKGTATPVVTEPEVPVTEPIPEPEPAPVVRETAVPVPTAPRKQANAASA
jgi:hypothetical protein